MWRRLRGDVAQLPGVAVRNDERLRDSDDYRELPDPVVDHVGKRIVTLWRASTAHSSSVQMHNAKHLTDPMGINISHTHAPRPPEGASKGRGAVGDCILRGEAPGWPKIVNKS